LNRVDCLEPTMPKRTFRPQTGPPPRDGFVRRLLLIALLSGSASGCAGCRQAVEEKKERAAVWAGCVVAHPPGSAGVWKPGELLDQWSDCARPPMRLLGDVAVVPTPPPAGASGTGGTE